MGTRFFGFGGGARMSKHARGEAGAQRVSRQGRRACSTWALHLRHSANLWQGKGTCSIADFAFGIRFAFHAFNVLDCI